MHTVMTGSGRYALTMPEGNTPKFVGKHQWRQHVLAARKKRHLEGSLPNAAYFTARLEELMSFLGARSIAAFHPFGTEPNVLPFVEKCDSVFVPRLLSPGGRQLPIGSWGVHFRGDSWEKPAGASFFQPTEPVSASAIQEADLLLTPALAVDRSGHRLGRGGGWYDRVLASRKPGQAVYAVVYACEVFPADSIPVTRLDQPVDGIVTEEEIIHL